MTEDIILDRQEVSELGLLPCLILNQLKQIKLIADVDENGWFELPSRIISDRLQLSSSIQYSTLNKLVRLNKVDVRRIKSVREVKLLD